MTVRAEERLKADAGDGVLWLRVDGAAARGLDTPAAAAEEGAALRLALWRALAGAASDAAPPRAVVLALHGWDWALDAGASGDVFGEAGGAGGADDPAPGLAAICDLIADGGVAVIVTLSGLVAGGGMDLALAADYSIARAEAQLGFPQAGHGALPEGGAVRRLARRVGAGAAMGLLTLARPVAARRALALGMVDSLATGDPDDTALAIARLIAAGRQGLPPRRDRSLGVTDPAAFLDAVDAARPRRGQGLRPARAALVGRIADCVAATVMLPEAEGRAFEATAVAEQAAQPETAALRHLAWAARPLPGPAGAAAGRPLRKVAVLGGASAAGLCGAFLSSGLAVQLVAPDGPALAEGFRRIAVAQDAAQAAGRLTPERRAADWARLDGALGADLAAEADLIVEAGKSDDRAVAALLDGLGRLVRRGTLLATAVPRDLVAIARLRGADAHRALPLFGLHLPDLGVPSRLVEFVLPPGAEAVPDATLAALARQMGRVAIRARDGTGFVTERLFAAWTEAVASGLAGGMAAEALARMLAGFGWAAPGLPAAVSAAAAATGTGTATGTDDGDAAAADWRGRMLAALANEGARLMAAGVVARGADIDLALVEGLGFPRDSGGAMHMADRAGLVPLRARLRQLAAAEGPAWTPSPLWDELIRGARRAAGWRAGG